jgi:hypothetical protein
LYASRRKALAAQKNFWGIALGQHPEVGEHLQDPEDAQAMTYLRDLWVERDPKEHRAFTIEFVSQECNVESLHLILFYASTLTKTRTLVTPFSRSRTHTPRHPRLPLNLPRLTSLALPT